MWHVTYFLIKIIHKITEAESVKKTYWLDWCTTVGSIDAQQYSRKWWRSFFKMAAISSMNISFQDSFLQTYTISIILVCRIDHAESEFQPPEFSKSLFYKI